MHMLFSNDTYIGSGGASSPKTFKTQEIRQNQGKYDPFLGKIWIEQKSFLGKMFDPRVYLELPRLWIHTITQYVEPLLAVKVPEITLHVDTWRFRCSHHIGWIMLQFFLCFSNVCYKYCNYAYLVFDFIIARLLNVMESIPDSWCSHYPSWRHEKQRLLIANRDENHDGIVSYVIKAYPL